MSAGNDGPAKLAEFWHRGRTGGALFAALFVGGAVAWFLGSRGERGFVERGGGAEVRQEGDFAGGEWEEADGISVRVGQVLRREANDSTPEDRSLVWRFLRDCCGAAAQTQNVSLFEVDEALTWLRGTVDPAAQIEAELMSLGADRALAESVRCFALQHLGMWSEEHPLGAETRAELRALTGEEAAGGVSAFALGILSKTRVRPADDAWLKTRVLEVLEAVDGPLERRVAALQIAVDLEALEVEPFARKLVEPSRRVAERVSAFFVLGRLGNRETLRWLSSQPPPLETLVLEARERAILNLAKR